MVLSASQDGSLYVFLYPGEEARGGKETKGFPKTTTSFWAEEDGQEMNRDDDMPGLPGRDSMYACMCVCGPCTAHLFMLQNGAIQQNFCRNVPQAVLTVATSHVWLLSEAWLV